MSRDSDRVGDVEPAGQVAARPGLQARLPHGDVAVGAGFLLPLPGFFGVGQRDQSAQQPECASSGQARQAGGDLRIDPSGGVLAQAGSVDLADDLAGPVPADRT